MLFEQRTQVPEVSAQWVEARDLFLEGKSRQARDLANEMRGKTSLESANDFILNIEIARAASEHKTYYALSRMGIRRFHDHPFMQLYHSRVLLSRNRNWKAVGYLLDLQSTLGKTHRALWGTELANVYGNANFEKKCRYWLDQVSDDPGINSPLALYSQSCSYQGLLQWEEATIKAQACMEAAPNWSRARAYLAHCLLSRGRIEEAKAEIADAKQRGFEDGQVDISEAMLTMSLGEFETARHQLEQLLQDWPDADFALWARRKLCILLVEMEENQLAKEYLKGFEAKLGMPEIPDESSGGHQLIPLPLVAQTRNQCVPTTVAMAAWPQGHQLDPEKLFVEMKGRDGTPLWRMRHWTKENGFELVPIKLQREAFIELLDKGLPLIGILTGAFNSHVDVICGYRDDLDVLYVRDPMHWTLVAWPWDMALARYELNHGVLAVIDQSKPEELEIATKWHSDELEAQIDLAESLAKGDLQQAEAAFGRISDDCPASYIRDSYALNVVISPKQFYDRMKQVAADPDANYVARFRAMTTLGSDSLDEILDELLKKDDAKSMGVGVRRYLNVRQSFAEGNWEEALRVIDQMLLTGAGVATFWEMQSDAYAELGKPEESREALELAIELEPLRMALREKSLNRSASNLTFSQYLDEFDRLLAEDSEDKHLLYGRAAALRDGPDGAAFEQAARETLHWFPRSPDAHLDLMYWFRMQLRPDLEEQAKQQAEKLLPDIFGEPEEEKGDEPSETTDSEGVPPLPDDKDQLIEIIWNLFDPRREEALQKIKQLHASGELTWYQTARWVSCRLAMPDKLDGQPNDPQQVLPAKVPGSPAWFARAVCDSLTSGTPTITVALAANEWLDQVLEDVTNHPEIWFERVLLLEHAKLVEQALEELNRMLEKYPAHASALYRLGMVNMGQRDYINARKHFERSLEVNPGLFGAMDRLREVHNVLGNTNESLDCTRMLRRKFPYSVDYLRQEVFAIAIEGEMDDVDRIIDENKDSFPSNRLSVMRSRVLLFKQRLEDAEREVAHLQIDESEPNEDLLEEYLQLKMAIATERNDNAQIRALCDMGLKRWPDSTRIKEILAEQLETDQPEEARKLLRDILLTGEPTAQTLSQFFSICGDDPLEELIKIAKQAEPQKRDVLVSLGIDAFSQVHAYDLLEAWLQFVCEELPDNSEAQVRLAYHYIFKGNANEALKLARQFLKNHPNDPEAENLLGTCLLEIDIRQAKPHLLKACKLDRSTHNLLELARCHQMLGEKQKAFDLHSEILKQNPFSASSWTNLFLLEAVAEELWDYLPPMIDNGYGEHEEYFLVAAVKVALKLQLPLPPNWYHVAMARWKALEQYPGYKSEKDELRRAILAWQVKRPSDKNGYDHAPKDFFGGLYARFFDPGIRWVPNLEPEES